MVHELIGLKNGAVSLTQNPDIPADLREVSLSTHTDSIFEELLHTNCGSV